MSDDNRINPASHGDFLTASVLARPGFTRPGPSDDTLASLEAAMTRGRLKALLGNRKITFPKWDQRWLREAHRAGAIHLAELDQLVEGTFPHSASQWPAADLLIEAHDAPEKQTRTVIRVQLREGHALPVRLSAFVNLMDKDQWLAIAPFTISRDGKVDFERRLVLPHPIICAAFIDMQQKIAGAAALISERHQRLTATRH